MSRILMNDCGIIYIHISIAHEDLKINITKFVFTIAHYTLVFASHGSLFDWVLW